MPFGLLVAGTILLSTLNMTEMTPARVFGQSQYSESTQISWSVDRWDIQAKPFAPISSGELNFTSNSDLRNASLVLSSEISDVLKISNRILTNITVGQKYHPQISFHMPPGTTSGWHNGTLALMVDEIPMSEALAINVLVPTINSTSQVSGNGTITYMVTPSYSPFFSNVVDIAVWFTFSNGTSVPVNYSYDVFDTSTDLENPSITVSTDKSTYHVGDKIIKVTGNVRTDTMSQDQENVYLTIFSDQPIPHEYHEFVPLISDGSFAIEIPIHGTFSSDGQFTISINYRGRDAETSINISDRVIGNFTAVSQALPVLRAGADTVIVNSETRAKIGMNYTLSFLVRSTYDEDVTSYLPIVEIRNSNGVTEALFINSGFKKGTLDRWYVEASWSPQVADTYSINTFLVTDLEHPVPLTAIKTTYVVVE